MTRLPAAVLGMIETVRSEGRDTLLETEAMRIASAIGIATPNHLVVAGPDADIDLGFAHGDRVVVKALAPGLSHKTEAGGVATVPATPDAVRAAILAMARSIPDASGFLVADHVEHDAGPGGEYLLGIRHTEAFGPIVTFGLGGTMVGFLDGLTAGGVASILSPALREAAWHAVERSVVAGPLLDGVRGAAPAVSGVGLRAVLDAALDLAASAVPSTFVEFEINPLVFVDGAPIALDAVCRLGPVPPVDARDPLPPGAIATLLRPDTLGIIGVSSGMNPGRVILGNVLAAGFQSEDVVIVKPGADLIDGVRCVATIEEMGSVDTLVVAVGAQQAMDIVRDVAARSAARSIVLIPGGIGERDGTADLAGSVRAELSAAPDPRPVVNGPNCMGIRSIPGRIDTTFIPGHKTAPVGRTGRHPVAIVSASGAFVLSRHDRMPWLDPRYVITVGNQLDVTIGDHVDHLADDPDVRVVACYVEGFRPGDGLRWARAVNRITDRGGTVVLYTGGRSAAGADAAASHTAAVAGDDRVTASLARAAGAFVAETLDEFEDLLRIAVLLGAAPGRRVAAVSNAGFEAVAIADNLGDLTLATYAPETIARLGDVIERGGVSGMVSLRNPLDLTPSCGAGPYADAVSAILEDPGVDVAIVGCVPFTPSLDTLEPGGHHDEDVDAPSSLVSRLIRLSSPTPWVAVVDAGSAYDPMARRFEEAGIPTYRQADRATRAVATWAAAGSKDQKSRP